MPYCPTKAQLLDEAQETLKRLTELIGFQREVLASGGAENTVAAIDAQIEQAFGLKERRLGALYQHTHEHGC